MQKVIITEKTLLTITNPHPLNLHVQFPLKFYNKSNSLCSFFIYYGFLACLLDGTPILINGPYCLTLTSYTSSSNGEDSSEENASDTESTTSYEEGSYDGREGSIVYQCKDDVAIASGAPGAMMFDQNIREM